MHLCLFYSFHFFLLPFFFPLFLSTFIFFSTHLQPPLLIPFNFVYVKNYLFSFLANALLFIWLQQISGIALAHLTFGGTVRPRNSLSTDTENPTVKHNLGSLKKHFDDLSTYTGNKTQGMKITNLLICAILELIYITFAREWGGVGDQLSQWQARIRFGFLKSDKLATNKVFFLFLQNLACLLY